MQSHKKDLKGNIKKSIDEAEAKPEISDILICYETPH